MQKIKRRAWKEYFKGNYLRAGDLYKTAGDLEKASKMYIKAGDYRAAADAEERLGRIDSALNFLLKVSDNTAAAEMLLRHGRYHKAANFFAKGGSLIKAAEAALKGDKLLLASEFYERAGMRMEAGRLAFRGDNIGKALLYFERVLKDRPVPDSFTPMEQLENREETMEIAHYFEKGEAYERAAELYEELNMTMQAAECWKAAKRYTKAAELYRMAGADDRLSALADLVDEAPPELQADSLIAAGKPEEAARLLVGAGKKDRAAALFESAGNFAAAAELRSELGDYEIAGNLFFKTESYMAAADCFRHSGLFAMAEDCFLKAGDEKNASLMAFESGSWERALDLAPDDEQKKCLLSKLQALSGSPGEGNRIALLKARSFVELDQPKVALSCLQDFKAATNEENLWHLYLTGRITEKLEDFKKAAECYRQILAEDVSFQDVGVRLKNLESLARSVQQERERYVAVKQVGEDPVGSWIKAKDTLSGREVLVYRVGEKAAELLTLPDGPELSPVRALSHPNILRLTDSFRGKEGFSLVYENFEGRPLSLWQKEGYKASMYSMMDKLHQVLEAFTEAHEQKITHGFFSPASVWMNTEGLVKVSGLGLVRRSSSIKSLKGAVDLLPYRLPESDDLEAPPAKIDLYSVGCVFFELLSGTPPGSNGNTQPLSVEVADLGLPDNVTKILSRLLATDLGAGYVTAREVVTEISAQEFPPGAIIAGRYEVLEELGRGGMGQVFRVKDRELDEVVALKTLRKRTGMTEESRVRFLREIKISRRITHPNVVRVFDFGAWRDLIFLTMEFIPGVTLTEWVKKGFDKKSTLRQKLEILRGVVSGLEEAHKLGIIHRDLKPQNVILSPSGVPKLLDFGIALVKVEESADLTQDGHFVGSPKYVSPEQIKGEPLGPRSDIYSLGLLAYFLLTGRDGFEGSKATLVLLKQLNEMPPLPSTLARIPPRLEKLVMSCLLKDPEKRPSSLAEVTAALKDLV